MEKDCCLHTAIRYDGADALGVTLRRRRRYCGAGPEIQRGSILRRASKKRATVGFSLVLLFFGWVG